MSFLPLLQFDGDCAEAFALYARVFRADDLTLTRYWEAPEAARLPASDRVIYAEMRVGQSLLLGMDFPTGMPAPEGRHAAVNWRVETAAEGEHLFALLLAEGGFAILPFAPGAWSAGLGMLRDRFGVIWLISTPGTPADPMPPAA